MKLTRNEKRRAMSLAIKKFCIKELGEVCNMCRKKYSPQVMCFHHIIEEDKKFKISDKIQSYKSSPNKFMQGGYKEIIKELDKCVLLCHNCHNYLHEKDDYVGKIDIQSEFLLKKIEEIKND